MHAVGQPSIVTGDGGRRTLAGLLEHVIVRAEPGLGERLDLHGPVGAPGHAAGEDLLAIVERIGGGPMRC
jgi:hypothetical protein